MIFQIHQSIGNLRVAEDYTSQDKLSQIEIGIPVERDPDPYRTNLFLYVFKSKYFQQLISKGYSRTYKLHGTSRFIDEL